MKKILKNICLPVVIGLLASSTTFATGKVLSFGKGNDYIHNTQIKLNHDDYIFVNATLYQGVKKDGVCGDGRAVGYLQGNVHKDQSIAAPSELFGGELTPDSCALEVFVTAEKSESISYDLKNDGTVITAADPSKQDITLD